jgi:DNA polymerase-3 subunit alpha
MAFITVEDLYGTMEVIVFPTVYNRFSGLLEDESMVLINGRISIKEDEQPKIICDDVKPLKKIKIQKLYLKIQKEDSMEASVESLLKFFNGNTPVCLYNEDNKSVKVLEKDYWVDMNDCLMKELKCRLGEENVKVVSGAFNLSDEKSGK